MWGLVLEGTVYPAVKKLGAGIKKPPKETDRRILSYNGVKVFDSNDRLIGGSYQETSKKGC